MEFKQDEFYIYIEKRSYFSQVFSKEEGNDEDWGTHGCGVSHYSPCNNTALCVGRFGHRK